MDEFGPVLYNLYGSTEVAWATIATPERPAARRPARSGRPPPHTRLEILDDDGQSAAARRDRPHLRGARDAVRGLHRPEPEPRARRRDDDPGRPRATSTSSGRLFIDSREDDMIISGGENVYPGQVEEVLRDASRRRRRGRDRGRGRAVRPAPGRIRRAAAGQRPDRGGRRSRFGRENLARFKVPREVHLRDELPRNALGKVLRRELRPTRLAH